MQKLASLPLTYKLDTTSLNMRVIDPNRDLHNWDKKLEYWMKRIKEDKYLDKKSRNDLLRFIDFIGNEDQVGALRKVRYISILLLVMKNLTRSFRNANKQDINKVRKKLEGTNKENEVDSFLTKEEIARVVPNATSLQRRALIALQLILEEGRKRCSGH